MLTSPPTRTRGSSSNMSCCFDCDALAENENDLQQGPLSLYGCYLRRAFLQIPSRELARIVLADM
jgi:hypothetical protein